MPRAPGRIHCRGSTRNRVVRSLVSAWANTNPQAAAAYVSQLPDGTEKNQIATSLAFSWANQDPQAAAAWVAQLPAGDSRDNLIGQIASHVGQYRPQRCRQMGRKSSRGKSHDHAVQSLAQQIAQTDPANAARWVDTIQDENIWRSAAMIDRLAMVRVDEAAAKAWVAQSQLPDEFKQNFAQQKP